MAALAVQRKPIPAKSAVISLPVPPSLNHCFPTNKNGHRYPSKEYQNWRKEAGYRLNTQRPQAFHGAVEIWVTLPEPPRACDADNRLKPILDLLVTYKIIPTDSNKCVRRVSIGFSGEEGGSAEVSITQAGEWITRRGACKQ